MDDDFMHEDDEIDFEDDDENEEMETDSENKYYNAKGLKDEDINEALLEFQNVINSDSEKGEWSFKSTKQMFKIYYRLNNLPQALICYDQLLSFCKRISKNYTEKSINSLLDLVASCGDKQFLHEFYTRTLACNQVCCNDRLDIKTKLRLCQIYLSGKNHEKLNSLLRDLTRVINPEDSRLGTFLLEVYAIEIQLCTETKNDSRLKALYNLCLSVKSVMVHPKVLGVVRECGGKMRVREGEWNEAQTDFFEAFKCYDEAGSDSRINCLKYLVLANMLAGSQINPFDSQETKPYKNNPQITVMTDLVSAFQSGNIWEFEKILQANKNDLIKDQFIWANISNVLRTIRTKVLIRLVKAYRTIKLSFIAEQLGYGVSLEEVESLLISAILNGEICGEIDQLSGTLELFRNNHEDVERETIQSLQKWKSTVESLSHRIFTCIKR